MRRRSWVQSGQCASAEVCWRTWCQSSTHAGTRGFKWRRDGASLPGCLVLRAWLSSVNYLDGFPGFGFACSRPAPSSPPRLPDPVVGIYSTLAPWVWRFGQRVTSPAARPMLGHCSGLFAQQRDFIGPDRTGLPLQAGVPTCCRWVLFPSRDRDLKHRVQMSQSFWSDVINKGRYQTISICLMDAAEPHCFLIADTYEWIFFFFLE